MTDTCKEALFIKLGQGNKWANECFEDNFVRLDYAEISHELASGLPGNIEVVLQTAIKPRWPLKVLHLWPVKLLHPGHRKLIC